MANSWLSLSSIFLHFIILHFSCRVSAIRKDISFQNVRRICRTTVQGRYFLADDNGYVCDALSVDPESRCCPAKGDKFSCYGCDIHSKCCNSYEHCVSCCQDPMQTQKKQVLNIKIAKPTTAGTYASVFDYCAGRCRHNSASVVHENAYISDFHHCYSLTSNSSAGANSTFTEARLFGINVVVGRQGEACASVCKSHGLSCVPNKLALLNHCDMMEQYLSCKGACLAGMGADRPGIVVDDAPFYLNPGVCLSTRAKSTLSCDGSHKYTKRLCPCA